MKKLILMLAIGASVFSANAQKTVKVEKVQQETEVVASEKRAMRKWSRYAKVLLRGICMRDLPER